jgi:hypothetical protein
VDGTKIHTYRDLVPAEKQLINEIKAAERNAAEFWRSLADWPTVDERWLGIARTHLQEGFSALVRSVARPEDPFTTEGKTDD